MKKSLARALFFGFVVVAAIAIIYILLTEKRDILASIEVDTHGKTESKSLPKSGDAAPKKQLLDRLKRADVLGKELTQRTRGTGPRDDLMDVEQLSPEELAIIEEIDDRHFYQARVGLKNIHDSELPNSKWTDRVEKYVSDMVSSGRFEGTSVQDVDCRKTLCKLVLLHTGEESVQTFMQNGISEGPWQEGSQHGFTNAKENGEVESTVFFSDEKTGSIPFNRVRQSIIEEVEREYGVDAKIGAKSNHS